MPTTSRVTLFGVSAMWTRFLLGNALLSAHLAAFACSPGKSIDVFFAKNSSVLSAEQVLRLASWTAMLRQQYPHRQSIDMAANAEVGEQDAQDLATKRADHVIHLFTDNLQFNAPTINPPTKGNVYPAGALGREDVKRVEIDFLPACPHECPCQMGDPLYKPSVPR